MLSAYERACKNALDVQDACNFSGVLLSFAQDMDAVRTHLKILGDGCYATADLANHPVALWYLDKLLSLQGRPKHSRLSEACRELERVVAEAQARDQLVAAG